MGTGNKHYGVFSNLLQKYMGYQWLEIAKGSFTP